jgi:hypothetical protein
MTNIRRKMRLTNITTVALALEQAWNSALPGRSVAARNEVLWAVRWSSGGASATPEFLVRRRREAAGAPDRQGLRKPLVRRIDDRGADVRAAGGAAIHALLVPRRRARRSAPAGTLMAQRRLPCAGLARGSIDARPRARTSRADRAGTARELTCSRLFSSLTLVRGL